MRKFSLIDNILSELDSAVRTLIPPQQRCSQRPIPGAALPNPSLTIAEKKHIQGLLRVNHSGEVCALGLYLGQSKTAQLTRVKDHMAAAAQEETEHLAWCEQRLRELQTQPSVLNPLWYLGSFMIGALAGWAGDRISLGFVMETERQVAAHLEKHLQLLPAQDEKTRLILQQMQTDEAQHAEDAWQAGAIDLPDLIKTLMQGVSKIMTQTSYHI